MPAVVASGVRDSAQTNEADRSLGIQQAVVQDASGAAYDVFATDSDAGRQRLSGRAKAARTLADFWGANGLSFAVDKVLAYEPGEDPASPTRPHAVLVTMHRAGVSRPLDLLTLEDCSAMGTVIGAIHRIPPSFLGKGGYPVFSTKDIRAQLATWTVQLRRSGHIPREITESWSRLLDTEGLWAFSTCFVHGRFRDGDVLFDGSIVTAITNWQDMQVNDPARDLAWIFAKLDADHRNAVLASYGRMMGSRLDSMIMPRANLWLQIEQVGEFVQALDRADNDRITRCRAQVERLAHQLGVASARVSGRRGVEQGQAGRPSPHSPSSSTITVGSLLDSPDRQDPTANAAEKSNPTPAPGAARDAAPAHHAAASVPRHASPSADSRTITLRGMSVEFNDELSEETGETRRGSDVTKADHDADSVARAVTVDGHAQSPDGIATQGIHASDSSASTTVIPQVEQQRLAERNAEADLASGDMRLNDLGRAVTPTATPTPRRLDGSQGSPEA
ncbi:phosphotransferase [uncultured Bifidobacterium sp.]|uniref:phosphotransferase n=1 Tax=uncultured Bifidobacterium sp. TaxID=165187 RepID=UPI0028DCB170|nr:phosphotransferase [uncultured Bifidobacterium sp.]